MLESLAHTFGEAQGQQDFVVQELDVNYPPIAARVQARDLVERRGRRAADAVDNFDLRFEYAGLRGGGLISTVSSIPAPIGADLLSNGFSSETTAVYVTPSTPFWKVILSIVQHGSQEQYL